MGTELRCHRRRLPGLTVLLLAGTALALAGCAIPPKPAPRVEPKASLAYSVTCAVGFGAFFAAIVTLPLWLQSNMGPAPFPRRSS